MVQDLLTNALQARSTLKAELNSNESIKEQLETLKEREKTRIAKLIELKFETAQRALSNNRTDILSRDRQLSAIESELQATLER